MNPSTSSVFPVHPTSVIAVLPVDCTEYSTSTTIAYQPTSSLVQYNWTSAWDVLAYLLFRPYDRHALMKEAQRRSPTHPKAYPIYHGRLRGELSINSFDTDYIFIIKIEDLMRKLERREHLYPLPHYILTYSATAQILHASPDHLYKGLGPVGM